MIKVKICGITNLEDALNSVNAGCDALGFVFYKQSPRYIKPEKAQSIIKQLPRDIIKVGVFVDAKEKTIKRIAKLCRLDILQFHGRESPGFLERFKGYKIIKAFRVNPVRSPHQRCGNRFWRFTSNGVKDKIDLAQIAKYKAFAYLFDTFVESKVGGTGKQFNWELLSKLGNIRKPIFLSGGLNAQNVKRAIKQVKPDWLDVSSSVEIEPGKKDYKKVKEFIKAVKNT